MRTRGGCEIPTRGDTDQAEQVTKLQGAFNGQFTHADNDFAAKMTQAMYVKVHTGRLQSGLPLEPEVRIRDSPSTQVVVVRSQSRPFVAPSLARTV